MSNRIDIAIDLVYETDEEDWEVIAGRIRGIITMTAQFGSDLAWSRSDFSDKMSLNGYNWEDSQSDE